MDDARASLITVGHCDPTADKHALALALQAWPEAERAGHWQEIRAAAQRRETTDWILLAVRQAQSLVAAVLARRLPGRAALVWLPQFADSHADHALLAKLLISRLDAELQQAGVHVAQSLLTANDQTGAALLESAAFRRTAGLLYLAAPANKCPDQPLALPFEIELFSDNSAARLARLIDRTYVGTKDCPQLDGLRDTADVLIGYQAVGQFRPELWQIARHGGDDVGCLLLNVHSDVRHAEIVYLGFVPEVRGRGWGLELTRHAMWLARQAGCEQTVLAVDAANDPAICMYATAGFSQWDERAVWTKSLR